MMRASVSQSLLRCATHSTSMGRRGSHFNGYLAYRITNQCKSQCFILPRRVWCSFTDPGRMEDVVGSDGKSEPDVWDWEHARRFRVVVLTKICYC